MRLVQECSVVASVVDKKLDVSILLEALVIEVSKNQESKRIDIGFGVWAST